MLKSKLMVRGIFKLSAILLAIAVGAAMGGCAKSANDTQQADQISKAESLLNQQDYTGAISYLNEVLAGDPGNLKFESLLANAYMGRAGLSLIPIFNGLIGAQTKQASLYWRPGCDLGAVNSISDLSFECVFYRLLLQLPFSADNADILAAQSIYRTYFPDPSAASDQINFVAGTVEVASALTRAAALLDPALVQQMTYGVNVDPRRFPYETSIHHAKRFLTELDWALQRFNHSYVDLNRFLSSINGSEILTMGTQTLRFNGSLRTSDILRFAAAVIQDQTVVVDQYLSQLATEKMNQLATGQLELIQAADPTDITINPSGRFEITLHATDYLSTVLNGFADQSDGKVRISLAELMWNKPTPIITDFLTAAEQAWEAESGAPLQSYYAAYGARWSAFKSIVSGWDQWLNQDMSPSTKAQVLSATKTRAAQYQQILALPNTGTLNPDNLANWILTLTSFMNSQIGDIASQSPVSNPAVPLLTPQITKAFSLIDQTDAWMTQNFYPVSDWAVIVPPSSQPTR